MDMKKLLVKSLLSKQPVQMIYMDSQDRCTQRIIYVKELDDKQVRAFCTLRGQLRTFRLENILSVQWEKILDQRRA